MYIYIETHLYSQVQMGREIFSFANGCFSLTSILALDTTRRTGFVTMPRRNPAITSLGPFTPPQAARVARVDYETINLWIRTGLIRPSVSEGRRSRGIWRLFSFRDLIALRVAGELRRDAISMQRRRRLVNYVLTHESTENPGVRGKLVLHDDDVVMVSNEQLGGVIERPGQRFLSYVIDMNRLARAVREEVLKIVAEADSAVPAPQQLRLQAIAP
jgi:hypothetical protein